MLIVLERGTEGARRFILYDTKYGEGFNLQREVRESSLSVGSRSLEDVIGCVHWAMSGFGTLGLSAFGLHVREDADTFP